MPDTRRALHLLGLIILLSAVLLAARDKKPRHSASASGSTATIPSDKRIVHALNRFTFGVRPGDVERVHAMGLDKWFDEQLHPEKINDSALDARSPPVAHPEDEHTGDGGGRLRLRRCCGRWKTAACPCRTIPPNGRFTSPRSRDCSSASRINKRTAVKTRALLSANSDDMKMDSRSDPGSNRRKTPCMPRLTRCIFCNSLPGTAMTRF